MKKSWRLLGLVAGLLLVVSNLAASRAALAAPALDSDTVVEEAGTKDMELVLLQANGRIHVEDPYVAPGTEKVEFDSKETGWRLVRAGDFNGDGDQELVAIGGGDLMVYDPVVPSGSTACTFERNIAPDKWELLATGDIDKDGRDEILLVRTSGASKWLLLVYDGDATGRTWTEQLRVDFNYPWRDMVVGDFVGDERVELALIRDYGNLVHILNPQTGAVIVSEGFGKEWQGIAAGDFNHDGKDELAVIRNVISPVGAGFVILRVRGVGLPLEAIYSEMFGSYWLKVGSGDLDGATNDEVVLLRNVPSPYKGLIARDLKTPTVDLNVVIGTGWEDMAIGDLDGDGADEVIIMSPSVVRAYRVVPTSVIKSYAGSWRIGLTVADLDGSGIVRNPTMQIKPTSLTFEMEYKGTNPPSQKVQIRNSTSTSSFNWTATPSQSWVQVSPASGTADATWRDVTVSINGARLPIGTVKTRVKFSATTAGVGGSPQRLLVTVKVRRPSLVLVPTTINVTARVGEPVANRQITVGQTGSGTGTVNWVAGVIPAATWQQVLQQMQMAPLTEVDVSPEGVHTDLDGLIYDYEAVDWISIAPDRGTTPAIVVVSFDTSGLEPGTHMATIIFDSGRETDPAERFKWVDVTLTLAPAASSWHYAPLAVSSETM
ncbi:MAG: BACON domain-containing protein [Anaerolineae bacterium]